MNADFIPIHCPSCGSTLELNQTKVDLMCLNSEYCPAQILNRLAYFTNRGNANIEGLSEKTIEKFIQKQNVRDIPDLFKLDYESAKEWEGFGQKSIEKLRESIDKCRLGIVDYKFLASLGIDGVGPEVAKLIVSKIDFTKTKLSD